MSQLPERLMFLQGVQESEVPTSAFLFLFLEKYHKHCDIIPARLSFQFKKLHPQICNGVGLWRLWTTEVRFARLLDLIIIFISLIQSDSISCMENRHFFCVCKPENDALILNCRHKKNVLTNFIEEIIKSITHKANLLVFFGNFGNIHCWPYTSSVSNSDKKRRKSLLHFLSHHDTSNW